MSLTRSCSTSVSDEDSIIVVPVDPILAATTEDESTSLCFVAIILTGRAVHILWQGLFEFLDILGIVARSQFMLHDPAADFPVMQT